MSYIILRGRWCQVIVLNVHAPTEDKTDEELERVFDKFPKYHMKILLGDFNAKVGREDIFKPTSGNESLHKISNDSGVRIVNFATSKNLRVKSTMFLHCNIYKYTWKSPDGKTQNQIDHILVDRRRHSNVLDVRSFRAADCDAYHYLVVAKVRERLALNKQGSQRFDMEKFSLQKLNYVEGKKQFRVEVSNRFAALEDLDTGGN
jgi:endonuclease/exonuclease/phosphatase family metal-dependent hydrolase